MIQQFCHTNNCNFLNRKRYLTALISFLDYAISEEKLSSCQSDCKNIALLLSAISSDLSQIPLVGSKQTFLIMTPMYFLINFECLRYLMAFKYCVDVLSKNCKCFTLLNLRT